MDSLELDGEPATEAIQPMGTFVDTVMLACWHWLNPKNGKEDDLVQLCISASQIELRKDFDTIFGRGHGVTVKPKGSSKFTYVNGIAEFDDDKGGTVENPTKTQRVIQRFLDSNARSAKAFRNGAKSNQREGGRFVVTKHKLGFENEITLV